LNARWICVKEAEVHRLKQGSEVKMQELKLFWMDIYDAPLEAGVLDVSTWGAACYRLTSPSPPK